MIPKKVHFIFGLAEDFGGKPFSFVHFLSIRSFLHHNPDFTAYLYYAFEPWGVYWDAARPLVNLVRCAAPTEVFGNPLCHVAHQADVLRLDILIDQGGIYLDLDTITARSFADLLHHDTVLGQEFVDGKIVGLCNAVIAARAQSPFLCLWRDSYRSFRSRGHDAYWNEHSVQLPAALIAQQPGAVTELGFDAFFDPTYSEASLRDFFFNNTRYPNAYCHHLWESITWNLLSRINEGNLSLFGCSTFARLASECMTETDKTRIKAARKHRTERLLAGPVWLNMGCGGNMLVDYLNVDQHSEVGPDIVCNFARERWPLADGSVDQVIFIHTLEHIGAEFEFVMRELYRVCRPGAFVRITAPHPAHDWFLGDPTHVRPIVPATFEHLDREKCILGLLTGDRKTPLALYWNVDFETTKANYRLDSQYEELEAAGRLPARELAVRHINNAIAEVEIELRVRKQMP